MNGTWWGPFGGPLKQENCQLIQGIHADASLGQMRIHCMSCDAQSTVFFLGTVVPVFAPLMMGLHVAHIPSNDKLDKRTS